jgi:broad specificity phosphatase PhoE
VKRILLMRHAEKPIDDIDPDLSTEGQQRANRLATYIPQTFGTIGFLFAAAPSKHSVRPIATITPLSAAISVPINTEFADKDYALLARELVNRPQYSGAIALVCWHHEYLPDFAKALGAAPEQVGKHWHSPVFNVIWRLDYAQGSDVSEFSSITEPF